MKKIIAIILASLMCIGIVGCTKKDDNFKNNNISQSQKIQILNNLAEKLEEIQVNTGNDVTINFRIELDETCKMILTYKDTGDVIYLAEADSVDNMWQLYRDNGILTENGQIVGFQPIEKAPETPTMTPQEILESTELDGEDGTIAGFPGEGDIDVGSVPIEFFTEEEAEK